jgi:hypothetical protein
MAIAQANHFVLMESEWRARRSAHEARVRAWTDPHQARAERGIAHPVYDFLFSYYAFRPAWLRRWHPGPDVVLIGESAREFLQWPMYRPIEYRGEPQFAERTHSEETGFGVQLGPLIPTRRRFVAWLGELLQSMGERPPYFGCFGLHEWAMVYRQSPEERRHSAYPLRFAPEELARIVEGQTVCCSHFDAFRFFTNSAKPLNRLQPARTEVGRLEQRGCLHANMDLYKWAFKLAPFAPSELIADCFELALAIREIDMRASPYDLAPLGFRPIRIETPEGRAEYEQHQRAFTKRGEPLRQQLIALCSRLLAD